LIGNIVESIVRRAITAQRRAIDPRLNLRHFRFLFGFMGFSLTPGPPSSMKSF
jgi:hypothetical protein